nr:hypothetical protein [Lysobacter enzymogenes]
MRRADIYRREPARLDRFMVARLSQARALLLALSSGEALQRVLAQLPPPAAARLREARVSAASERLAQSAREAGFGDVGVAAGPARASCWRRWRTAIAAEAGSGDAARPGRARGPLQVDLSVPAGATAPANSDRSETARLE